MISVEKLRDGQQGDAAIMPQSQLEETDFRSNWRTLPTKRIITPFHYLQKTAGHAGKPNTTG